MSILYLIDKLLFRPIKGNYLFIAARNLLPVVAMLSWNVWPWSKLPAWYLYWFDHGKSVLLSDILYSSLLSCLRRENERIQFC